MATTDGIRRRTGLALATATVVLVVLAVPAAAAGGGASQANLPEGVGDCTAITTSGVYELTDDVNDTTTDGECFNLAADDVVLDGQGHVVNGSVAGTDTGIESANRDNVTVQNVTVVDATGFNSLRLQNVTGLTVRDVTVRDPDAAPDVDLRGSRQVTVDGLVAVGGTVEFGEGAEGTTVTGDLGETPFRFGENATDTTIREVEGTPTFDVDDGASDTRFLNVTLSGTTGTAVEVGASTGTVVRDSDIVADGTALSLDGPASDLLVADSRLEAGAGDALAVGSPRNATVSGSVLRAGGDGVDLAGDATAGLTMESVVVREAGGDGVDLDAGGAVDLSVSDSRFVGNDRGLNLTGGSVAVTDTTVAGNARAGVRVAGDTALTLRNGSLTGNGAAVRATATATVADVRVRATRFGDNGVGVDSANQTAVLDARRNDWGGRPGSPDDPDAPLVDPVTGAAADGDGDTVSEGVTAGVANVRFDPVANGTVSGRVRDDSGRPVAGVTVVATGEDGTAGATTTDADGRYSLALQPGTYDLTATGEGVENATTTVTVESGNDATGELSLARAPDDEDGNEDEDPARSPYVRVRVASANGPVTVGETLRVDLRVRNVDDDHRYPWVLLQVDGAVHDVRTVSVGAREERAVTLAWTPGPDDVGTHDVVARGPLSVGAFEVTVRPRDAATGPGETSDGAGVLARADRDGDGRIGDADLDSAITAWSRGEYTDGQLNAVIAAWAEGVGDDP
jgi:hypothetical protein